MPNDMTTTRKDAHVDASEAEGRERGYRENGGQPGNDLLENGQLRGVDEDGAVQGGTHGGPKEPPPPKP